MNRDDVRAIVRSILAADLACAPDDFLQAGIHLTRAEKRPGRRAFPWREKSLGVVGMGPAVVVSSAAERLGWLREMLGGLEASAVFSAPAMASLQRFVAADDQALVGPQLKYVCSQGDVRETRPPDGVEVDLVEGAALADLSWLDGFRNALARPGHPERPDVLAAVATERGAVVGVAGASADHARMWQIGVDVVARARGRGIGRAVVGRLTRGILGRGRVPYYTTTVSNVASQNVAVAVGFWPAWVEMYVVDLPRPPISAPDEAGAEATRTPAARTVGAMNVSASDEAGVAPTLTDGVILLDAYTLADVEAQTSGEDEEHARRFGWYPNRSTPKTVGDWIVKTREDWRRGEPTRAFAARDPATRSLLGGCEIRLQGDGLAHMSWWTLAPYRRRGVATRSVRLAAAYAFAHLGVERLEAYVETDNVGSRGVARSAWFVQEGILRRQARIGGERRDMVVYGRLRDEGV